MCLMQAQLNAKLKISFQNDSYYLLRKKLY